MIKIIKGEPVLYFDELEAAISDRFQQSIHDFSGSLGTKHFDEWCKKRGYRGKDPEGKPRKNSVIWRQEYTSDPEGEATIPLYQNFWHVWKRFAKFRGFGGSKLLVISKIHADIQAASGKPSRKQVRDWEYTKSLIEQSMHYDEQRRASVLMAYHRSHREDYELAWTNEIFEVVYDLVGEYKDARVRVKYGDH